MTFLLLKKSIFAYSGKVAEILLVKHVSRKMKNAECRAHMGSLSFHLEKGLDPGKSEF